MANPKLPVEPPVNLSAAVKTAAVPADTHDTPLMGVIKIDEILGPGVIRVDIPHIK